MATTDDPSTPSSGIQVEVDTSFTGTDEPLEGDLAPVASILASLPDMSAQVAALGDLEGKPPKPIMGAIIALAKDSWSAWTGGKPKANWTGLDPSAQLDTTSPNQLRPVYVSAAQKGYNHRRTGMIVQFKPTDDLVSFQNAVWDHLTDTGMDSIAYLPDPTDHTKMTNVVKSHSRYTVQSAQNLVKPQLVKYDKYDKTNDRAARTYLLASLTVTLSNKVSEKLEESDPFPIVWLQFLKSIQSTSIERFEDLKSSIKMRLPSQYSGENLEQLAGQFRKDALELSTAGQYDHNLTLSMMKIFLLAGGTGNEDFRFPLRATKQRLEQALLDIGFKEKTAANDYMVEQKLTYKDICTQAEDTYRTLYDRKEWPPARNVRDSKAPPSAYGNIAATADNSPITRAEVLTLIQTKPSPRFGKQSGEGTKKPGNCNKCGKPGHWANECPDNNKQQTSNQRYQRQDGRRGSRPNNDRNARKPGWRSTPPAAGAPTTKKTETHTFHWCATCKRWSTTHSTETHTGGKPTPSNGAPAAMNASALVQDPSVWVTEADNRPSVDDMLFVIRNLPIPTKIILSLNLLPLSMVFVSFMLNIFRSMAPVFDSALGQLTWRLIVDILSKTSQSLLTFLQHRYHLSFAPLLWIFLAHSLFWTHSSLDDRLASPMRDSTPRWQRRRQRREARNHRRRQNRSPAKSIRTEGFHRKYPINLRAMGEYMRRPPPGINSLYESKAHLPEMHRKIDCLQNAVLQLTREVRALQQLSDRTPAHVSTYPAPNQNWPRQHPVPHVTREGDERHDRHYERSSPSVNQSSRARRAENRSHPATGFPAPSTAAYPSPVRSNSRHPTRNARTPAHVQMAQLDLQTVSPSMNVALHAPSRFRNALSQDATFSVIWDSGASVTISPNKKDFVGPITSPSTITQLKGIAKGLRIEGQGQVRWSVHNTSGGLRHLTLPAYYVPKIRVRLLSTTSLLQTYNAETIKVEAHQLTLSGVPGCPDRTTVTARVNPDNNLPTSDAHREKDTPQAAECLNATITAVNDANINLSEPEKELLRWHYRLGHIGFTRIQFLMRTGVLTRSNNKKHLHQAACKIEHPPKCAACQYGKQHRRPAPGRTSVTVQDRAGVLKQDHLIPGQQVSVDHFVCSTKGRLFTSAGKTADNEMYVGGCLFNDHASGYVHVEFQNHLTTHETLMSKENYELMCRDNGVIPQSYLSDNAKCFTAKEYTEKLSLFQQIARFAGVGAHHHNGNAERSIQTIMSIARTMMLHSAIHWPEVADPTLWPMAVSHAVYLHNHMPNLATGLSPVDLFTKTRWPQHKFHDLHVWGCPVYVLDKSISDGKKLPRWKPRSVRCFNIGLSPKHASTVPLVLNVDSGYITPQFHVVFDDWFSTIATSIAQLPDFNSPSWSTLFGESSYQYPFDDDEATDLLIVDADASDTANQSRSDSVADAMDHSIDALPVLPTPTTAFPMTPHPTSLPTSPSSSSSHPSPRPVPMSSPREMTPNRDLSSHSDDRDASIVPNRTPIQPQSLFPSPTPSPALPPTREPFASPPAPPTPMPQTREHTPPTREPIAQPHQPPTPQVAAPAPSPPKPQQPRRSTRQRTAPSRLGYDGLQGRGYFADPQAWLFQECGLPSPPLVLKATPSDPDTLSYDEAMSDTASNVVKWMEAAAKEIMSLEKNGTWIEVETSTAKTRILPGTWVFRRKRTPDGQVSKYKARYCVRGDLEDGEPETFAPVVAWSSVRLFLILALTLNWDTCSIDFSSAFVQAKLKDPVWIHLPRGFQSETVQGSKRCLKLIKSLYGLSVAPRLWFAHVLEAFTSQGFKQSQNDPCFLYKSTIMVVLYVDDVGIAYANQSDLDHLLTNLTKKGLEFTKEGTFTDFLGIKFVKDVVNNTVTLTQRGLIQKIIEATGMSDCNPNWTPAIQQTLGIDPDGEAMNEEWSYPSIVGMLLYLSTNTRPDISFAVSQVARFNHSPKRSHASAIKTIVRYLHRTADKGMIVHPTGDLSIDCYVDADFAGLHGRDPDHEPSSAKSRTGYIITLGGCPILWKSQLQTEISLSTLEAEYSALSASMRTLLPLKSMLSEIVVALNLPPQFKSTIRCRVFEDNNGALLLATKQRITNRTKYFLVKWHFFWSHVQNGEVVVLKIDTKEQWADYLTKGLNREVFERIRKLVQGW